MVQRIYYRDVDAGSFIEISDRVDKMSWQVQENAEEGSVAMSRITVEDPDMDITFNGHRRFVITEDESEATDNVIFSGYTDGQTIARKAGDTLYPLGRSWQLSLYDMNGIWQRRVMVGADCKRPAESDTERMAWLLSTNEAGLLDDVTTWVSAAAGVNMDACDYRGQMFSAIVGDCAQASGRNFWITELETGALRERWAWYLKDSSTLYSSDLFLTNDPTQWSEAALEAGTSLVWPISMDTELKRDPGRVFWGCYLPYEKGAVYRTRAATAVNFAKRDFVAPSKNVKSKTKAIARALRYLDDIDAQDERITTTVELPAGKATMLRAGMRVQFKATHLPGYEDWVWLRVLSCAIKPVAAGTRYQLTVELQGPGTSPEGDGTVTEGGIVLTANDNLVTVSPTASRDVDWMATGDVHGPGIADRPLDTDAFAYLLDSGYTVGFTVLATSGTLSLRLVLSAIWAHTEAPNVTFTASIHAGGATYSQDFDYIYEGWEATIITFDFTVTGVALAANDTITATLSQDTPLSLTIPAGTGQGTQLEILAGSVVVL